MLITTPMQPFITLEEQAAQEVLEGPGVQVGPAAQEVPEVRVEQAVQEVQEPRAQVG